ncbi:MAG: type IV pilin N-terminal domain-containing protein [Methanocorpusculum sp.]|nr:type IV pilin N-terminal domain-containing protein [Methanocorpusculum sp.]
MQRRTNTKKDDAVSPVVGVMLMLVVTIIIAAVVSGYAGGVMSSQKTTPSASIETTIDVTDDLDDGKDKVSFTMLVKSISEPVNTSDVKLVTTFMKDGKLYEQTITADPKKQNFSAVPFGAGTGIEKQGWIFSIDGDRANATTTNSMFAYSTSNTHQWFGNYTLMTGTYMIAEGKDELKLIFGKSGDVFAYDHTKSNHEQILRPGDVVNVKLIYIPSGQAMYSADVKVQ